MLKTVFKSLLGDASKIIDEVVTTKEEKLTLKLQMKQIEKMKHFMLIQILPMHLVVAK